LHSDPVLGDAMFYGHIGLLHVIAGFVLILLGYRLILYFVQKSEKAELLLVGGPSYIIRDGAFITERLQTLNMGRDELFGELRSQGVEHLGQIKSAVIEDDGEISLSFYDNIQVKSGLPLLPDEYLKKSTEILERGLYACCRCGTTRQLEKHETHRCEACNGQEWVRSLDRLRIL